MTLGLDFPDPDPGLLTVVRAPSPPLIRITLSTDLPARTQGWRRVRGADRPCRIDSIDTLEQHLRR